MINKLFQRVINRSMPKKRWLSPFHAFSLSFENTKINWVYSLLSTLSAAFLKSEAELLVYSDPTDKENAGVILQVCVVDNMNKELYEALKGSVHLFREQNTEKTKIYHEKIKDELIKAVKEMKTNEGGTWEADLELTKRLNKDFYAVQVVGHYTSGKTQGEITYEVFIPVGFDLIYVNAFISRANRLIYEDLENIAQSIEVHFSNEGTKNTIAKEGTRSMKINIDKGIKRITIVINLIVVAFLLLALGVSSIGISFALGSTAVIWLIYFTLRWIAMGFLNL